jgi:hypothetical protein
MAALTRRQYVEQIRRQVYGGFPTSDAEITANLVNQWLNEGIGLAAKQSYVDSLKLEGIAYVNNSFYTTYKALAVSADENGVWKITLPHVPIGIGANEGISTIKFKSSIGEISYPVVTMTQNQLSFHRGMREIPNKLLAYSEGTFVYVMSSIILSQYTASVTMVSGGDSTNLDSVLNVPADYLPVITEYLKKQLQFERLQPVDATDDGMDATNFA